MDPLERPILSVVHPLRDMRVSGLPLMPWDVSWSDWLDRS
jgi:hypothetical protein